MLVSLADQANDSGVCWPSVGTLTKRTCLSERACQRAIQQLQEAGHISREDRMGRSTIFHIHPRQADTPTPVTVAPLPRHTATPRGATQTPRGATQSPRIVTESSDEPSLTSGRAKAPSPVAAAFKAYQDGIKARYQGDYPPSAKANGQLAQVVGRVGAANAVTVVQAYLAHAEPFYAKTKHSLDFLVRDCEKIWVELQAAAGAAAPKAPTTARVALLRDDGTVIKELDERPAGDMLKIAIESAKRYSTMIASLKPKYVGVRQGPERRRFPLEELRT